MKKAMASLLAFFLFLSIIPISTYAEEDSPSSVLESIRVESAAVEAGDTVKLTVKLHSTQLTTKVTVKYGDPYYGNGALADLLPTADPDTFEGIVNVPANRMSGMLPVTEVALYQGTYDYLILSGNPENLYYVKALRDGDLNVTEAATPASAEILDTQGWIQGRVKAGAKVVIAAVNGVQLGEGLVYADGTFYIGGITPQKLGTKVVLTTISSSGALKAESMVTVVDKTPPDMPGINPVYDTTTAVSGTAEPGATVSVHDSVKLLASGLAGADGSFSIRIPAQQAGTFLHLVVTDASGNSSHAAMILVEQTPKTGWVLKNSVWYYYDTYYDYAVGWRQIGGVWYYFDSRGAMKIGWFRDKGRWYYLSASGAMKTGWVVDGSSWYFTDGSGAMKTGWILDGGTWYYLTPGSGEMVTGWYKDRYTWYYSNSSGAMQTGWVLDGGKWYYLKASGAMVTGRQRVNGKLYTFGSDGALQ